MSNNRYTCDIKVGLQFSDMRIIQMLISDTTLYLRAMNETTCFKFRTQNELQFYSTIFMLIKIKEHRDMMCTYCKLMIKSTRCT